ncbi:MAG: hypothetical protein ACOZNI_29705 [Myxococcota bacterium]
MRGLSAILLASLTSVATDWAWTPDTRAPCEDAPAWDPHAPLLLRMMDPPVETATFRAGIHVHDADGDEVPVLIAGDGDAVWICPIGGLAPDADYTWTVAWEGTPANELPPPAFELEGTWSFHTAATSVLQPAADEGGCAALGEWHGRNCAGPDTGDSG